MSKRGLFELTSFMKENHGDSRSIRIKKTDNVLRILHDFEQGLETLRSWMDSVETSLQKPLVVSNFTANELRVHQQAILVSNHSFANAEITGESSRQSKKMWRNMRLM